MNRRLCELVCGLVFITSVLPVRAEIPKNVILMIGDGMGFEHVKATGFYQGGLLSFELFPYQGQVTTYSANSATLADGATDSAAAATAMATGQKVDNGVLSVAQPGKGSELRTLIEMFSGRGAATGLVTTTPMTNATPAAFGAHEVSRTNDAAIASDYLTQTRPTVLFGGGGHGMNAADASAAGYTVVTTRAEMQAVDSATAGMISGQFGTDRLPYEFDEPFDSLPHLSEMTEVALNILDDDPDGFFLMVEGGLIDWAAHDYSIGRTVRETLEFSHSVDAVLNWAAGRGDTLILVTADHETGGLLVADNNGVGALPDVTWSETGHTSANVPIYAWGVNASLVDGVMDNTDIFHIASVPEPSTWMLFTAGLMAVWWGTCRARHAGGCRTGSHPVHARS